MKLQSNIMAAFFGLHVGRTNSCVAVFKDGKTDVIANDSGERVTPAIVAYSSEETTVGLPAKQGLFRNASSTVLKCKELFGICDEELDFSTIQANNLCPVVKKNDGIFYELMIDERTCLFSPKDVLEQIYRKLYDIAIHHSNLSENSVKAVLSVPLSYTTQQRQCIWKIAEKAGFTVLQIISEPAAALLAYGIGQTSKHESLKCVVYRCGGATLDVSVIGVQGGMYKIINSVHRKIGGDKFTTLIAGFLADEFQNKWKLNPRESKRSMHKLLSAAEESKHVLSTLNTAHCFVESLVEGVDLSVNVSRARVDMLVTQLLNDFMEPVKVCLSISGCSPQDIQKVVLCGGATKMPRLQQAIAEALPSSELLSNIVGDEVIALGCCQQAAIIGEPWDPLCQQRQVALQALSKAIYIKCGGEGETHILPVFASSTPLPSRHSVVIPLGKKHNIAVIEVMEENNVLAQMTLENLPEAPSVAANFHLSNDGSLHVALTEKITNITTAVTITSTTN